MDCDNVRKLLDPYLDTELDLMTILEVESHITECPGCEHRLQNRQKLRETLQSDEFYFRAPTKLRASISQTDPSGLVNRVRGTPWMGLVATFVVGVLFAAGLLPKLMMTSPFADVAQQVVASHIRSLMADHLSDVISTDQHTVKPWFDGKLDFSPVVVDLADQGFPLIGGRLDYLDNRSVTALVYQRAKHIINLFEWPATGSAKSAFQTETIQGYHALNWVKSAVTYWAVSDVEIDELQNFVSLIETHASQPS